MVEAAVFMPFIVIAATQIIKMALPQVTGFITILVALVVGILIAVVDTGIGVTDITIAQGIIAALEAVGITAAFAKAGGGAKGDDTTPAR